MTIPNTDDLENTIQELDSLLYKGYILKTTTVDDWNKRFEQRDETLDLNKCETAFEIEINKWLTETATLLVNRFHEKHLYFHFVHPKQKALSSTHALGRLILALERHLFALEEIIVRLEERSNLAIRREIAEKEYQVDILYSISYSNHSREIKLNNIVLKRPDFNSENDNCFQFIYKNPSRPIGIAELEQAVGEKLKKRLAHIVRDLGFEHELKDIFFPVVTKNEVMFVNPITKQYAQKHNLPPINFLKLERQSKPE